MCLSRNLVEKGAKNIRSNSIREKFIHCNSSFAIKLSKNLVMHGDNKYIDVHFHFLWDLAQTGMIKLVCCTALEQLVDAMTKFDDFLKLYTILRVCVDNSIN